MEAARLMSTGKAFRAAAEQVQSPDTGHVLSVACGQKEGQGGSSMAGKGPSEGP